jgi:predicted metal-dependent HD superfamily phosphohydrolase
MNTNADQQSTLPEWLSHINPTFVEGCAPILFEVVREAYNTPSRFYHTWQHITACLDVFAVRSFDNPRTVLLALLFHDAIYVPGRKDNEAKSAELAEQLIAQYSNVPIEERQKIARLILLTANHHAQNHNLSADEAKLIDIDLSILGAEWSVYERYAQDVRREFCPAVTSEFRFRVGRIAFLKSVLRQPKIFLTSSMQNHEDPARANMKKELQILAKEAGVAGRLIAIFV